MTTIEAEPRQLLRADAAAKRLAVCTTTFYQWVKDGRIKPGVKVSTHTVVWDSRYISEVIDRIVAGNFTKEVA